MKEIKIEKEEVKLSLFVGVLILCPEDSKAPPKTVKAIKFNKVSGFKIKIEINSFSIYQ